MKKGMIYVFTGDGKGKTSAALGTTLRALSTGFRVAWLAFYKGEDWEIAEKKLRENFPKLEMYFMGKGFYIPDGEEKGGVKVVSVNKGKVVDRAEKDEHVDSVQRGLNLAKRKLESGDYDLVIMDEINNAVADGLVESRQVLEVLGSRGRTHVVMTGRGASEEIIEEADLVTECKKVKHPYDQGEVAVKGLDY